MRLKTISVVLLLSISFLANAAGRLHPTGNEIKGIKILSDGSVVGIFTTNHHDPDGCSSADNSFYISASHPGKDSMLAIALAAKATKEKVTVYVAGCDANGPQVTTMDIL